MVAKFNILCILALLCSLPNTSRGNQLSVATFSTSRLEGWEDKVFTGTTSYQLVHLKDKKVLAAESQNSGSALIKKIHVDIKKCPYLNWSWRIYNRLDIENEKITSGDDYAARIYVVVDGGILL